MSSVTRFGFGWLSPSSMLGGGIANNPYANGTKQLMPSDKDYEEQLMNKYHRVSINAYAPCSGAYYPSEPQTVYMSLEECLEEYSEERILQALQEREKKTKWIWR